MNKTDPRALWVYHLMQVPSQISKEGERQTEKWANNHFPFWKNIKTDLYLTLYTKINSSCIRDPKVKNQASGS